MTLIDHYNQVNKPRLARRNSDEKNRDDKILNCDSDLIRIRLLVNKK